jgi:uncharacterized membrane protein YdjX (TVP38/TMEM64 family)
VSVASTTGATLAFLISRYLARPFAEGKLREYPKFGAVDGAIGREGAKIVLLLRLSPLFPFNLWVPLFLACGGGGGWRGF